MNEISSVRNSAAYGIGKIAQSLTGPKLQEAVSALIWALKDANKKVRYEAAFMLEGIGPEAKEAIPALTEALNDEDSSVRSGCRRSEED